MGVQTFIKEMRQLDELQDFAEAQYKTILDLTKKNHSLDEEVKKLKILLEKTSSVVPSTEGGALLPYSLGIPEEQIIAEVQIKKLSEISFGRELTLEETRRLEIFCKILTNIKSSKKEEKLVNSKTFNTADLLTLVDNVDSK